MENFVSPYVKNIQTNARIKRIRSIIYPKMFSLRLIFQSKTFQERLFYINVKLEIHKGSKNFMGEISKANRSRAISKYQHDERISDLISRHERFVSVPRKRGIAKVIVRVAGIGSVSNDRSFHGRMENGWEKKDDLVDGSLDPPWHQGIGMRRGALEETMISLQYHFGRAVSDSIAVVELTNRGAP